MIFQNREQRMKLKETVKKEIEKMDIDEILLLYEQIKLFKKKKIILKVNIP
jgi:hypothetical protein